LPTPREVSRLRKINELRRLLKIESLLRQAFKMADGEGLYLGAGRDDRLPENKQEGPIFRQLRKLTLSA